MKPNLPTSEALKARRIVLRTAIFTALSISLAYIALAPKEKCKQMVEVANRTKPVDTINAFYNHSEIPTPLPIDTAGLLLNIELRHMDLIANINNQDLLFYQFSSEYYQTKKDKYRVMGNNTQVVKKKMIKVERSMKDSIDELSKAIKTNHSEIKK